MPTASDVFVDTSGWAYYLDRQVELDGVLQLEPECAVLPRVMTGDAAPDQLVALVEGGDFHHRVKVSTEGPVLLRANLGFGGAQPGTPPASETVCSGKCGPDGCCWGVDVKKVMDSLHKVFSS